MGSGASKEDRGAIKDNTGTTKESLGASEVSKRSLVSRTKREEKENTAERPASHKPSSKSVTFEDTKPSEDVAASAESENEVQSKEENQKTKDQEKSKQTVLTTRTTTKQAPSESKESKQASSKPTKTTGTESDSEETKDTSFKGKKENDKSEKDMRKEADGILSTQLKLYEKTKDYWKNADVTSKELRDQIKAVRNSYTAFGKFPYRIKYDYRGKLITPVINSGTMEVVCDVAVKVLEENAYFTQNDQGQREVVKNQANMLVDCLQIVCSFTDTALKARLFVVDHKKLLPLLVHKLDGWYQSHMDGTRLDIEQKLVNRSLTALFMVAAQEDRKHMDNLRDVDNFFPVVKKYLSSKETDNRLTAIATLAYTAKEAEAEEIATDKDIIRFLLKQLQQAYTRKDLTSPSGWTITGLAKAVKNLARNDANKRLLVQEGALPVLFNGLKDEHQKSHNLAERKCCMESLWWLSFDPQNREEMSKNEELVDMVLKIYQQGPGTDTNNCFAAAEGFLFQLRDNLMHKDKYASIANKLLDEKSRTSPSTEMGHVMMSYQTQHRPIVKSLCDFLRDKGGFRMWMDIYNMAEGEESTLQTMAEAVEGSSVVLMGVSDGYKNSPYCRAEAEYAFMKNKPIIPLKLQKGYTPDGWLGIIQGSKYFYDFTKESAMEEKRQQLLDAVRKAVTAQGGDSANVQQTKAPPLQTSVIPSTPGETPVEAKVKSWTQKDIKGWLASFQLSGEKLEALKADEILYLYSLKSEAPELFHNMVRDELGLTGLSRPAAFNKALAELSSFVDGSS